MVEDWTGKLKLHHLNQSRKCEGVYTYGNPGGPRSAIDHVLVNNILMEHLKGMYIDENREELNISDHNLVKTWFNINRGEKTTWKKPKYEQKVWYKKDPESMKKMEKELLSMIGKKTGFNQVMKKIKIAQEKTLKVVKRVKIGRRGETHIAAAEWFDEELKENIKKRGRLSKKQRVVRKREEPQEIINRYETEYKDQQRLTARMTEEKKGQLGEIKNKRCKGKWKNIMEPNK